MTEGRDLVGGVPSAPRKRGRPPGSGNKRPKDFRGWIDGTTGSSAAMQSAHLCLVTTKELAKAKGDHGRAVMAKAAGHVAAYQEAAEALDGGLRAMIRAEVETMADEIGTAEADQVRGLVKRFLDRVQVHASRFTLAQAVEAMAKERQALMPYTDQRQPQLVALKDDRKPPVMILVGGSPGQGEIVQGNQGPIIDVGFEVLQPKSHEDAET